MRTRVGVSYDQKPYRRAMIETWGGTVHRSATGLTEAGRSQASHQSGSLGLAISEAVEVAANRRTPTARSAQSSTTSACTRR